MTRELRKALGSKGMLSWDHASNCNTCYAAMGELNVPRTMMIRINGELMCRFTPTPSTKRVCATAFVLWVPLLARALEMFGAIETLKNIEILRNK